MNPAHVWHNKHADDCPVTRYRAQLLSDLSAEPTNQYLLGALPEYDKGGDQEVENCTCLMFNPVVGVMEIVTYNPDDFNTYPSVCHDAREVRARFGFVGGEHLLFDKSGSYIGKLSHELKGG